MYKFCINLHCVWFAWGFKYKPKIRQIFFCFMQRIKRGSILKGKSKVLNKAFVGFMSLVLATMICFAGIVLNKTKYANAAIEIGSKYSQKDESDIVLSVEKVGIVSTGDDYLLSADYDTMQNYFADSSYPFKKTLYQDAGRAEELNKLAVDNIRAGVSEYPNYYFKNISDGANAKTVYHSGDYIMLENSLKSKTVNGNTYTYYYNPSIKAYDESTEVDMAEGVLFSFGSYYLGTKVDADNNVSTDLIRNSESETVGFTYAKNIQQINVSATHNGEQVILPVVRQYGENNYQDFTYIIPQRKGFDGHYEFVVEYRHNEEFKRQTFTFDLVFKSTYTEPETFTSGSGYSYATMPKIDLQITGRDYFLLGSSEQYPTLTYDFSKFTLDYTHTLNGITTNYSYRRVQKASIGTAYDLVCTITNSNGTITKTVGLTDETKAVIVFTEIGHYAFSYDYIYNGEQNSMGFTIEGDSFDIYGYELKYSKIGYSEAQMRYLQINKHVNDKVVLVVPNGYMKAEQPDTETKLGVVYDVNETTQVGLNNRTGYVNKTKDTLINVTLGSNLNATITSASATIPAIENITQSMYQTTNQGGVWLASNLNYDSGASFYFYSLTPIISMSSDSLQQAMTNKTILKENITNTTAFNKVGYYLVFVKADLGGSNDDFYQVFAFKYTNETAVVEVYAETLDENGNKTGEYTTAVGSGKYTKQNVQIKWQEPDVFERSITVKYYSAKNTYITKDENKANGSGILTANQLREQVIASEIQNGTVLGSELTSGEGASFLLEATNEGQAKSYRSFTIDRTDITGVSMYAVGLIAGNNNSMAYRIQTDVNGYYKKIEAIADIYGTIYWNDKQSGAKITANYYFTPIVKNASIIPMAFNSSSSAVWFLNKYELGTQTGPFKIDKPEQLYNTLNASNVLKNAGVYTFELTDEAGNSCKYMFVLDTSEQYFKIDDEFFTQENLVFASNVKVEFGTHKAVKMFSQTKSGMSLTEKLIDLFAGNATDSALKNAGYFVGTGNNISALKTLFNSYDGYDYLTVKNEILTTYNQNGDVEKIGETILKPSSTQNPYYNVDRENKLESEFNFTSYKRKLNIYGANQFGYTNQVIKNDSKSYIWVEINDDHSLGKVYFSNDSNSLENETSLQIKGMELSTGKNIKGAQATSADYLAFYWTQGTGDYQIDKITYDYYPLTNSFNTTNKDLFFYDTFTTSNLYLNGEQANSVSGQTDRYFKAINVADNQTQAGLYVVKRYYINNSVPQEYWFIVDRNAIISDSIGQFINIKLLEETEFKKFDTVGLTEKSFVYYGNGTSVQESVTYTIDLVTNKVPAQIKVPVGKYFNGSSASGYYAGRLNFTIYYLDTQYQYGTTYNNGSTVTPVKLFSTKEFRESLTDKEAYYTENDYLIVDLNKYLTGALHDRYIITENDSSWLWLPGDYVIVIEDNVKSSNLLTNKKAIAFTIDALKPSTDVFATVNETDKIENAVIKAEYNSVKGIYQLTTNAEFVKLVLPKYEETKTNAQVDPNYLDIDQISADGATSKYIYHEYKNLGGLKALTDFEMGEDGSRVILLDTKIVRGADGNIDLSASAKQLIYNIKIRFKISSGVDNYNEKYRNCYAMYVDNSLDYYYETIYTIVIDREPTTANTTALENADNLAKYYNEQNGIYKMFDLAVHDTASGLYFTNEFVKYYKTKNVADLFAFAVDKDTPFSSTDIKKLYTKKWESLSGAVLNMPVTSFATYTPISNPIGLTRFGNIFLSGDSGYYEIVEEDNAGNLTQYLVLYSPNKEYLSFTFNATYIDETQNIKTDKITLDQISNTITLFDLNSVADDANVEPEDKFFHIELNKAKTGELKTINTNASTRFTNAGLTAQICEDIKNLGFGNYTLTVLSRLTNQTFTITYYDQNNRVELNVKNLVEKDSAGNYRINLHGANVEQDNIMYYASKIVVISSAGTQEYTCKIENGEFKYYLTDAQTETKIITGLLGTYQIIMTDAFGKSSTYRFDTASGDIFHNISFERATETNNKYYENANCYYGFTTATVEYNTTLYKKVIVSYKIDGNKVDYVVEFTKDGLVVTKNGIIETNYSSIKYKYASSSAEIIKISDDGHISVLPFTATNEGKTVQYSVELWFDGTVEYTYNILLDTYTKAVSLKNTDNVAHNLNFAYNEDYEKVAFSSTTSGVMNLMWAQVENDYFVYSYTLHESLTDGTIASYDLNDQTSYVVNTKSTSKGVYWFEIAVSTVDGKYLGNKVYAFSVVAVLTDLYYVQTEDMEAIKANSYFKFSELVDFDSNALKLGDETEIILPITNIPLYISNKRLTAVIAEDQGATAISTGAIEYQDVYGNIIGKFKVYRVYTKTYSRYFATLEMTKPEDNCIANNFQYANSSTATKTDIEQFATSVYLTTSENLVLTFGQTNAIKDNITRKNSIVLNVYHNGVLVESCVQNNNGGQIQYTIKGSGKYSFEVFDLAGNCHEFTFGEETGQLLTITCVKNVYFTMNGGAPIENGVFNDAVELAVYEPFIYDSINAKPITVQATLNGQPYTPSQKGFAYMFESYGNYVVTFNAKFNNKDVNKTISFTILNKNEARVSFDLTSIARYTILKVTNQDGKVVTNEFLALINPQSENGRLLTYSTLMANADSLYINAGKQSFELTYEVNDGIYPVRQASFVLTLNDEIPTIDCSVELGKETTKGFDITFNPGMIYEQIGDSFLYINDTLVCEITEESALQLMQYSISQKTDGANDYYVKLMGSSGNVITSFKVVVKEPLNIWAIIIIVVVSVIVIGVTITIFVLRNRMRIR